MAHIFCFSNQKGGVGKTTTCINLAATLAQKKKKILVVDLDPQGNATTGSGVNKRKLTHSVYHLLLDMASFDEVVVHAEAGGYDLLPSNRDLAGSEVELVDMDNRDIRLRMVLEKESERYDYILIDCSPSISLLTVNALCASQGVIIPMQCEYFALEGLADLVETVKFIHSEKNANLNMIGLLRVMFDARMSLQAQVSAQLKEHFGTWVFETVIPRNVRMAEAPSYGIPGVLYDPASKGARAYVKLAEEILAKMEPHSKKKIHRR